MALHFVLDEPTDAGAGDAVVLTGSEAHHAASVRRVRVGEEVTVGDGRGAWLTGRCESVAPREVVVRIESRTDAAAPRPRVVLVQALAKGDRDELAVQAATELGIDEIVPWQAARSVSRWDAAKAEKGRARTDQSFFVPRADIVAQGYDLSLNRYKEVVREEVEHRDPLDIIADLEKLNAEITADLAELKAMLA